jgi:hypothetical protein
MWSDRLIPQGMTNSWKSDISYDHEKNNKFLKNIQDFRMVEV